jgi:formylmethanofuran dehydrogenase subunit B
VTDSIEPTVWENVPSPFCGIASDDLTIEVQGTRLRVLANGDAVTRPAFEQAITDTSPRLAGKPAPLAEAVAQASALLQKARLPLFSGFGTDVNDTRAALALADRCGGVFDQSRAEAGMRNLLALQDAGWMATTLGEVKNRVDVLLVVGTDIEASFPRFYERFIWNREALFGPDPRKREVICLGKAASGTAATSPDGRSPQVIPCAKEELPEVIGALCALARGHRLQNRQIAGIAIGELESLIAKLRQSRYSVVAWAAGALDFSHAELAVQQLCRLITQLNKETRCSALPLGGQDGDRTASQVCAWITGYPTRVGFGRGYPEYDPYHFSTLRLLASGEADLLVWVSSLSISPPPASSPPTIAIGRSGMQFKREPEVYIPVGTPGIDHAGHMFRCDNVIALPLRKLRDSGLPSAASVLTAIEQGLQAD